MIDIHELVGDGLFQLGGDAGQRLDAFKVGDGDDAQAGQVQVDLAGLQARQHLGALHHVEVQLVDLGRALEVIGVGCQLDVVVTVIGDHSEGTVGHIGLLEEGRSHQLLGGDVLEHMLRDDPQAAGDGVVEGVHRHRLLGDELDGVVVHLHQALGLAAFRQEAVFVKAQEVGVHIGVDGANFFVGDAADGEDQVVGIHRLAIGPFGAGVQLDGEGEVILGGHRFSQHRLELHVAVHLHQRQEHEAGDVACHLAHRRQGVDGAGRVGDAQVDDLLAVGRLGRLLGLSRRRFLCAAGLLAASRQGDT